MFFSVVKLRGGLVRIYVINGYMDRDGIITAALDMVKRMYGNGYIYNITSSGEDYCKVTIEYVLYNRYRRHNTQVAMAERMYRGNRANR